MPTTRGYVGTVRVNDEQSGSRIWVSLTEQAAGSGWLRLADRRAWFFINLADAHQSVRMAQLSLLMESMREGLHCEIRHQGVSSTIWWASQGDAYEIERVRILRQGLRF
jgi:hypothetical protein